MKRRTMTAGVAGGLLNGRNGEVWDARVDQRRQRPGLVVVIGLLTALVVGAGTAALAAALLGEVDARAKGSNQAFTVASMARIQASSQRVATIIKTIDEIALQTNTLALDAAVEVACARGGMGLAVVADEVRNLAQRVCGLPRPPRRPTTSYRWVTPAPLAGSRPGAAAGPLKHYLPKTT